MTTLTPHRGTATEIAAAVRQGALSIADVAAFYVDRTERYAQTLNTHLHWDRDAIAAQVEAQTARLKAGAELPLAGVPVAIKDNICQRGVPTTAASKILKGYRPPYDATVIERLRDAGAILFGKVNLDEFAMGGSNEHSAYGPVRNPWDPARVPGGSSGGSAAAVAADLAPVALGSDTGGSVRQPAAFCGIVGLKPTYGRVSRYGLIAYASSLDQIGPMARTVQDTALLLDVISGHDERDSTSARRAPTQTLRALTQATSLAGIRVGVDEHFFGDGLAEDIAKAVRAAIERLRELGATIVPVSLPAIRYSLPAYYLIATAEASSNLARYDGVRYGLRHEEPHQSLKQMYRRSRSAGFGKEVKQRIMLGTFSLSAGYYDAYYGKAVRARAAITRDYERAFEKADVIVSPTAPTTAFRLGEERDDPWTEYLEDIYTVSVNLAGLPGISLPCGLDRAGLPIGVQLVAPPFAEDRLLSVSHLYEQGTTWHELHPKL